MNKLVELLNKLIELGWKPFGYEDIKSVINHGKYFVKFLDINGKSIEPYSLNDLCSLDSGLWKFIVNKRLLDLEEKYPQIHCPGCISYGWARVEYRLILSSTQENKTQFLLDNIKLGGEMIK